MRTLAFGLLMACLALPGHAGTEVCDDEPDAASTLACLQDQLSVFHDATEERLRDLAQELARYDANWADPGPNGAARLAASQAAWLVARDADCQLAAYAMAGGSGEALLTAACLIERQTERVHFLDSQLAQFRMDE